MKRKALVSVVGVLTLSFVVHAEERLKPKKGAAPVQVQIVEMSSGFEGKYQQGGVAGLIAGARTFATATTSKAIINGDHALLRCYENHSQCNVLGPGTYDAEIKVYKNSEPTIFSGSGPPDVWIYYVRPLDHKEIREHWKVAGTW
jgi:hypothetical protein